MGIADRLAAARGDISPDLVLRQARLVNVLSGEIVDTDIIIHDGYVVGFGPGYAGREIVELGGRYVCPGFIDAHIHIESSLCTPPEYGRAVVARGVTSIVTDPHEIANVLGINGIRYMLARGREAPLNVFVMASSCVPATHMETSGASLEAEDLSPLLDEPMVLGLAEVMNYPGVIHGDEDMLDKLTAFADRPIDGHAPAVTGKALNAYAASGIGSDHECTTVEEALTKLRLGQTIFIREGTTTRNLLPLLPMVTPLNHTRLCFCTDDRQPASILEDGTIDHMVRVAIANGIDPIIAIRMATINTANFFRLWNRGAVAAGRRADLIVFDDLSDVRADLVFHDGQLVARGGRALPAEASSTSVRLPASSMHVQGGTLAFGVPAASSHIRVITADQNQVVTGEWIAPARIIDDQVVADPARDILKIAVFERHHASGRSARAFIHGVGLKRGAIAGSVAHDHHNLIVIGADDVSMAAAAQAVIDLGGGLAAADGTDVMATLALPVAGLMTDAPMETVRRDYDRLIACAQQLGSNMHDPFMLMSFMGLEVIPKLKLTDLGLVDVEQFALVNVFAD